MGKEGDGTGYQAADPARMLAINSEHHLRSENLPFDIDVWYPLVKEFTFPSVFIPLTRSEAQAMVNYYMSRYILKKPSLTRDDVANLEQFEQRLDKALQDSGFLAGGHGAFLRMCGRSPKDGEPLRRRPVCEEYIRTIHELSGGPCDVLEVDVKVKLQGIARVPWLNVRSGAECMNLLLTSERVYADLVDWMHYGEPEQIVLRQWEDGMSLDHEFRAFVCGNRLTAISQYDHYGVYDSLVGRQEEIRSLIEKEWARIHSSVGVESYCADFIYIPGGENGGEGVVRLIELSPFLTCTGPALYSWKQDRGLLEGQDGATTVHMRVNTTLRPGLDDLISANWESRWGLISDRGARVKTDGPDVVELVTSQIAEMPTYSEWFSMAPRRSPVEALRVVARNAKNKLRSRPPFLLFVYGTLKSDFHWNHKFLSRSQLVCRATTDDVFPLVVGDCGVPYLLGDMPEQGKNIRGEVWAIDLESLNGMDDYEGVSKGYYSRRAVKVTPMNDGKAKPRRPLEAFVYVLRQSTTDLQQRPFLEEYTKEIHDRQYKAIRHIQVKQQLYMMNTASEVIPWDRGMEQGSSIPAVETAGH